MDDSLPKDYTPTQGFVEDKRDPLIDLNLSDSKELWLIQWPSNQNPDFDGLSASFSFNSDANLGTLEDSSGISYDWVSSKYRESQPMAFLPSSSEVKIAGKISRRVQLIHFHKPGEVLTQARRSTTSLSALSSRRSSLPSRTIVRDSQTKGGQTPLVNKNKKPSSTSGSGGTKAKSPGSRKRPSGSGASEPKSPGKRNEKTPPSNKIKRRQKPHLDQGVKDHEYGIIYAQKFYYK